MTFAHANWRSQWLFGGEVGIDTSVFIIGKIWQVRPRYTLHIHFMTHTWEIEWFGRIQ